MHPLQYHAGQIEVQEEAKSRELADRMAHWVGPAADFAARADLVLFAAPDATGTFTFTVLSGPAPLVRVLADGSLELPGAASARLPDGAYGGLAINLEEARRVRLNGRVRASVGRPVLDIDEAFTLCRKYMTRSASHALQLHIGPESSEMLSLEDPWVQSVVAGADTSFLASVAPDGAPDIAHRGGPPGFLEIDVAEQALRWSEYIGDGVFKSAGNIRATGQCALLVPDLASGDAVAITGRAIYENRRTLRGERRDPLEQHDIAHPVQGVMRCRVESVLRLHGAVHPRATLPAVARVTSASSADEQAPQ